MEANKYNNLLNYVSRNVYPHSWGKVQKRVLRRLSKNFAFQDGKLFYIGKGKKAQVVVGADSAKRIFSDFHSSLMGGHSGINKTKKSISTRFYWPNMTIDIEQWIKECDVCQKEQPALHVSSELQPIKVKEVWELIGVDLIGPLPTTQAGYRYILTATDYFSKWVEAFPIKTKSAVEVASKLLTMYLRHGSPKRILSDQGREFVNEVNSELSKLLQIERSVTAAYHPQTNGLDERTNANIKSTLSKFVNKHQNNWDLFLDHALFALRSKPQSTTKVSPFQLMYGREARFPCEVPEKLLQFILPTEREYVGIIEEMKTKRAEMQSQIKTNIEVAQEKQKEKYRNRVTRKYKPCTFKEGQSVLLRNCRRSTRKGGVLEQKFSGPYVVSELHGKLAKLVNANNVVLRRKFNIDMLRPYRTSSSQKASNETMDVEDSASSVPAVTPSNEISDRNDGATNEAEKLLAIWNKPAIGRLEAIVSKIKLYDSSFHSLKTAQWIVDEIIDAYLGKLCMSRPDSIAISATVCSAIFLGKYRSSVFRVPFEEMETVLCPVNTGVHWILLILKPSENKILLFDSLTADVPTYSGFLINWRDFLQAVKLPDYLQWQLVVQNNPKQLDNYNCGVFCMLFAESYLYQTPVLALTTQFEEMENCRMRIALNLLDSSESVDDFCGVCNESSTSMTSENFMGLCTECFRWIHVSCMQTDEVAFEGSGRFRCRKCSDTT